MMIPTAPPMTAAVPLAALGLLIALLLRRRRGGKGKFPPGPAGSPLLGNMLDMPKEMEWLTFQKWGRLYGDLVGVSILGRAYIVTNSVRVATDLLDKRSAAYSDRPVLTMGGELVGWDQAMILMPYGARFTQMRKMVHAVLGPRPVQKFWPVMERETRRFLRRLLAAPERYEDHVRGHAAAVILSVSHGYTVRDEGADPLVEVVERSLHGFSASTSPGAFLVDVLPFLKHVPSWMPGSRFKRQAARWRQDLMDAVDQPFQYTLSEIAKGSAPPSYVSEHLTDETTDEEKDLIKWAAFAMFGGGADTTVSAMLTFFLAMCTQPAAQARAQAELDAVVGRDRLPTFADRPRLPYTNALLEEVFRWAPVAPTAGPHRASKEDEYDGLRIPADSIILANIWGMMRDPDAYPDPAVFDPSRHLAAQPRDLPSSTIFGFGRRTCPGQHLADASLFLAISTTLAAFSIQKAFDARGRVLEPEIAWTPGSISHPKPFKCQIIPRSQKVVELTA